MSSKSEIRQAIRNEPDVRRRIFLENYLVCHDKMVYNGKLWHAWFYADTELSWMSPDTARKEKESTTRFLNNHNPRVDHFVSPHQATTYKHLTYWKEQNKGLWDFVYKINEKKLVGDNLVENEYEMNPISISPLGFCNVVSYVTKQTFTIRYPSETDPFYLYADFVLKPSDDILDFKLIPYNKITVNVRAEEKPTYHYHIGKAKICDYTYDVKQGYELPGNIEAGHYRETNLETLYTIEMPDLEITIYTFLRKKALQFALLLKELGAIVNTPFSEWATIVFLNDKHL